MADETNDVTTSEDESPVVTPSTTTPPPSQKTPELNTDIFCGDDGKRWKDKYYGLNGAMKQLKAQLSEEQGALIQQVTTLRDQVTERDASIEALKTKLQQLEVRAGEADQLPEVQSEVDRVKAELERMRTLVEYPEILSMKARKEGEEIEYNPFLKLIETTDMSQDELRETLKALSGFAQKESFTAPQPGIPSAPSSDPEDSNAMWAKVIAAQARISSGDTSKEAWDALSKAHADYRESQIPD